jgi:Rap1a immunity proteins
MRTISALIISLAMLLPGGAKAQNTAGELMQYCVKLESFWQRDPPTRGHTSIPHDAQTATCYGFILAVVQLSSIIHYMPTNDCSKGIGPNCRPALGICFPKNVSEGQILAVFLDYARSHSAQWHEPAGGEFLLAMLGAFACKDNKEPPRSN